MLGGEGGSWNSWEFHFIISSSHFISSLCYCSGYRSPSSYSAMGADAYQNRGGRSASNALALHPRREMRRTPSTSAIYETLRRSRELRETLSRPSSRLSFDNIPDKLRDPVVSSTLDDDLLKRHSCSWPCNFWACAFVIQADSQYYSDSEHHYTGSTYGQRQELRRLRNRTISGLEHLRSSTDDPNIPSSRPSSAQDRVITPSFANEKDNGQSFIDFNPAGEFY